MGGPQQGPPPSYGNMPPPQHYGNMPPQQPPPHGYGAGNLHDIHEMNSIVITK